MKKGNRKKNFSLLMIGLMLAVILTGSRAMAQEAGFALPELQSYLSEDSQTLYDAVRPLIVVADPDPAMQGIKTPGPSAADAMSAPEAAVSTFQFTYVAAGGQDKWGETCSTFPANAKTAFQAAAAIWAGKLKSAVPIKIRACWANLGSSSILGYSGGQPLHKNFANAPKTGTWYKGALANSIAGTDLNAAEFDMHITYNSGFTWYYGTDANPPAGQYDLVTVAAHEIGHGLNFSGSASYSGGTGSYGYGTGLPDIYDTYMKNGAGTALTSFTNPSAALGNLLTSNNLWFHGTNAMTANSGTRVKMYAPATWAGGSSYSHLDYNTFRGTTNSMMVYAVASGTANHNPGNVTVGLLQDLGWQVVTPNKNIPTPVSPAGTITDRTPTYKWTKVTGATQYRYQLLQGSTVVYTKTVASGACGVTYCTNTPTNTLNFLAYKWKVQAMVGGTWKAYSALKSFSVTAATKPKAGLWQDPLGIQFYVNPAQTSVDDFTLYVSVGAPCNSTYTIIHSALVPISNKQFSFTGAFNATGTFDTTTAAHGTVALDSYPITGCGNVSMPTYNWTASWIDATQPAFLVEGLTATVDSE